MATLPPPVSADRALALAAPPAVRGEGSATSANPSFVDLPVSVVSLDDPPPETSEDEPEKEALIDYHMLGQRRKHRTMKRRDIGL